MDSGTNVYSVGEPLIDERHNHHHVNDTLPACGPVTRGYSCAVAFAAGQLRGDPLRSCTARSPERTPRADPGRGVIVHMVASCTDGYGSLLHFAARCAPPPGSGCCARGEVQLEL